jgi:cell division protein ZapD
MLRLEYLFARFNHFIRSDDPELHHNAISILFDLGDIGARGDIKSLLLKEFERQKYALNGLKSSQKVDQEALSQTLTNIDSVASSINQSTGRPNSVITESEWLNAIRTRLNIPGGTSPIDLPSYHAWKNSPSTERRKLLENYVSPLLPWQDACQLFLRLLRQSGEAKDVVAHNGSFQQAPSGKVYQLMRISVEDDTLFSEISANKYMIWVRFTTQDCSDLRPKPLETDVQFELVLCYF